MAFHFHKEETVSAGIRRIVRNRIEDAMAQLRQTGGEHQEGIHEARKRLKEIRAVLRLVRDELGERFTLENRWYRDTGQALSEARDAQAAVETWDKLIARYPEETARLEPESTRGRLCDKARQIAAQADIATPRSLLDALGEARGRVKEWPVGHGGFEVIEPGVKRIYAQGRRAMNKAYARGDSETFHEWRKRVKDLWYHTTLLGPVWEKALRVRQKHLKTLSDLIGDDHDLTVFKNLIGNEPALFSEKHHGREQLLALIARRQDELRSEAHWVGSLIYAEKPGAYVKRIAAYWNVWQTCSLEDSVSDA